jgi:hypothetical protein
VWRQLEPLLGCRERRLDNGIDFLAVALGEFAVDVRERCPHLVAQLLHLPPLRHACLARLPRTRWLGAHALERVPERAQLRKLLTRLLKDLLLLRVDGPRPPLLFLLVQLRAMTRESGEGVVRVWSLQGEKWCKRERAGNVGERAGTGSAARAAPRSGGGNQKRPHPLVRIIIISSSS